MQNSENLRYADDTTLLTESKEELKGLLLKVKEESEKKPKSPLLKVKEEDAKAGFKLNIQKTKIMASNPIT